MLGYTLLLIFIGCAAFNQFRGKVRHKRLSLYFNDHSNWFAPLNCLFYIFSGVKNKPYIDIKDFPELNKLQENWETIRDEAVALRSQGEIADASKNDRSAYQSFYRRGWEKFGIYWYGRRFPSALEMCPNTVLIVESIPSIQMAMFTNLQPGTNLMPHRDPYAGTFRCQLALSTPNSNDCYLSVDGQDYYWRDGEMVMFDETYLHHVDNKNQQSDRIIMLLDIRRPVRFFLVDWLHRLITHLLIIPGMPRNRESERLGLINRVLPYIYPIRRFGKRIKELNKPTYYLLEYGIYSVLIYALFLR